MIVHTVIQALWEVDIGGLGLHNKLVNMIRACLKNGRRVREMAK